MFPAEVVGRSDGIKVYKILSWNSTLSSDLDVKLRGNGSILGQTSEGFLTFFNP